MNTIDAGSGTLWASSSRPPTVNTCASLAELVDVYEEVIWLVSRIGFKLMVKVEPPGSVKTWDP